MPQTGWAYAGAATQEETGSYPWSGIADAVGVPDDKFATADLASGMTSRKLQLTQYDLSALPYYATVDSLNAKNRVGASGAGVIRDHSLQLVVDGSPAGTSRPSGTNWPTTPADIEHDHGIDAAGWNVPTLEPAQVRAADFGVELAAQNTDGETPYTARLDAVGLQAAYTLPPVQYYGDQGHYGDPNDAARYY